MKLSSALGAVAAAATLNLHVAPATSSALAEVPDRPVARSQAWQAEVVSDEELADYRGGYLVAEDLAFEFGAVMRTFENGALSLQTQLVWTPEGPLLQHVVGDGVAPLSAAELGAVGLNDSFRTAGGSIVMHDLSRGQFMNLLINTQSGRDFRQDVDITLTLPGFGEAQGDMGRQLAGLRLAEELSMGSISALGGGL